MRAGGVEPLLLTLNDARTDSIGGMERKMRQAPLAVRDGDLVHPVSLVCLGCLVP
jgi:hypothetical protein